MIWLKCVFKETVIFFSRIYVKLVFHAGSNLWLSPKIQN